MPDAEIEPEQKAAWTAAAIILVASLTGAVVLAEWPLWGVQLDTGGEPHLVQPTEGGTELWPYTASGSSHDARTLGINIIIHGDSEHVRRTMMERAQLRWDETPPEEEDTDPDSVEIDPEAERLEDVIQWRKAGGSVRLTYVVVDGEPRWIDESYQLHSGTYLGQRMHIRAYEDPRGEWTAIQAHSEHWDWFRLRHTVTGISNAQREVELDFMGAPFVEEVSRLPYENATADSDGWVTVIRLSAFLLPGVAISLAARLQDTLRLAERLFYRHYRELALGAALFGLYLGVRAAGIWLELAFSTLPPKLIAAPLYLALVFGLPFAAYRLGRGSNRIWAFTHSVGGLGTAFVLDFVLMGVSVIPLRFGLHRIAVVVAIGLVAVGSAFAAEDENQIPLLFGLVGWALTLLLPVFGFI